MADITPYRNFAFGVTRAVKTERNGSTYLLAEQPLQPYPQRLTDRLQHWASTAPQRTWMARRNSAGTWVEISYAQAWDSAQRIGQSLLNRGLNAEKPVAILSENSLEHALLALGCMAVGVPYCSVSPAYSLLSQDFAKLRHVLDTLSPGLVYASDWARYGKAIEAVVSQGTEITTNTIATQSAFPWAISTFSSLLEVDTSPQIAQAMQATNSDTIVKFLFTSGSTKLPKAVVNTQRMLCANQQQMAQSMPALTQQPPVLVDWLPWSHTFGGNHNFGLTIYHGGTLYIDDGKPTPALVAETLRNLRDIAPTLYFNVPTGFEQIAAAMQTDDAAGRSLRKNLLSRCSLFFYVVPRSANPFGTACFKAKNAR